ncbi:MAG TPA: F0F1 ATP synthase subunit beta, partial [Anaerolineales bacterium]|nr:F0F1 ATP synthase subunit beta [Anaerolineales bacterium]
MTGRVAQIQGAVVDCEFPPDNLPEIYEAVEIPRDDAESLVLEGQKHLGDNLVRGVAMDATEGLRRGLAANATGAPIKVPVGEAALGRIFNVLGRAIDERGEVQAAEYYPIHRPAPPFEEQSTEVEG